MIQNYQNDDSKRQWLLIAFFCLTISAARGQGTDNAKGAVLFNQRCDACHKIDHRLVGPALGPQLSQETDDKYLVRWIQNSQALIAAKEPRATAIYNQFNQSIMPPFTDLSVTDINNIIGYVRGEWKNQQNKMKAPVAAPAQSINSKHGAASDFAIAIISAFAAVLFLVIIFLGWVINTLERRINKMESARLAGQSEKPGR